MSAPQQFDWAALMRAGLHDLALPPAQFWALTPAELAVKLGLEGGPAALSRARLEELAARFPDTRPDTRPDTPADTPKEAPDDRHS